MQKSIIWEIEQIQLKKLKHEMYINIVGWAFSKNKEDLTYHLYLNGTELPIQINTVQYKDIQNIYTKYLDSSDIGFTLSVPFRDEIEELVFKICTENEEVLYSPSKQEMQDITSVGEIEFFIEEYKYDVAKKEYYVIGWAHDITGAPVTLEILNEENQVIDVTLSQNVDISNGFKLTFPSEVDRKYQLKIYSNNDEKEILLISETSQSNIPTSKFAYTMKKGFRYFKRNGFIRTLKRIFLRKGELIHYNDWLREQQPSKEELIRQSQMNFKYAPKISVIVATFNTKESYLKEMIDSLVYQSYSNWELCIADGSTNNGVEVYVKEHYNTDPRIVFKKLEKNYGISGNMNAALEMVTGEYVGLFDHDDLITPDCLYEIVSSMQEVHHEVIYTDEDKLDDESHLFVEPHFKPDYSVDLLCSQNYITHFFVVKKELVDMVGGLREEYDGSQDHDFILRCCEQANSVHHIPKILYHWRMHLASTAMNSESKMYCYTSGKKAVQAHYERLHIRAKSEMMPYPLYGMYRSYYGTPGNPLVSIVIHSIVDAKILENCITSLLEINEYKNIEIILCNNEKLQLNIQIPVQWTISKNEAVQIANGDYILFLNANLVPTHAASLSEMLGYAMRKDVGCVGSKIINTKGNIEHCGIIFNEKGYVAKAFYGLKEDAFGYVGKPLIVCNYSIVSLACLMIKKSDFIAIGGIENGYSEVFEETDLCLKICSLKKVNIVTPYSVWQIRKSLGSEREYLFSNSEFKNKWKEVFERKDPFHNPNCNYDIAPYIVPFKKEF